MTRSPSTGEGNPSVDDFRSIDVIFGTRGNGGNSIFIKRLEETSDHYSSLTKFEKMDFIRQLITDWHGRFYMMTPDGDCTLVRDASPNSKLYTSVRRMMNYVVKKKSLNPSSKKAPSHAKEGEQGQVKVSGKKAQRKAGGIERRQNETSSPTSVAAVGDFDGLENAAIHALASLTSNHEDDGP